MRRIILLCLWLAAGSGSAAAEYRAGQQWPSHGHSDRHGVVIEPTIVVPIPPGSPSQVPIETADQLLHELAQCLAGGQPDLVLCLKGDMSSVAVRRLEACLGTYLIPEDPAPVRACFASIPR